MRARPETAVYFSQVVDKVEKAVGVANNMVYSYTENNPSACKSGVLDGKDGVAADSLSCGVERRN